jgi:hypothetical protein
MVGGGRQVNRKRAELPRSGSHLRSLDVEAARLFLAPGDIGHGPVGGLDMPRGALRFEERAGVAVADQSVREGRKKSGIAGQA